MNTLEQAIHVYDVPETDPEAGPVPQLSPHTKFPLDPGLNLYLPIRLLELSPLSILVGGSSNIASVLRQGLPPTYLRHGRSFNGAGVVQALFLLSLEKSGAVLSISVESPSIYYIVFTAETR